MVLTVANSWFNWLLLSATSPLMSLGSALRRRGPHLQPGELRTGTSGASNPDPRRQFPPGWLTHRDREEREVSCLPERVSKPAGVPAQCTDSISCCLLANSMARSSAQMYPGHGSVQEVRSVWSAWPRYQPPGCRDVVQSCGRCWLRGPETSNPSQKCPVLRRRVNSPLPLRFGELCSSEY